MGVKKLMGAPIVEDQHPCAVWFFALPNSIGRLKPTCFQPLPGSQGRMCEQGMEWLRGFVTLRRPW